MKYDISKKFIILTVLSICLILLFSGCVSQTQPETDNGGTETPKTVKIVDMVGRTVEVPTDVNKIVCSGPGALRLITYLQATDKVVGVEYMEKDSTTGRPYIMAHDELTALPVTGNGGPQDINAGPDPEKILNLEPDVIFITYMEAGKADEVQQKTGTPVVILNYGSLGNFKNDDMFNSLELAGKILGKENRADEVISFIEGCQDDLNSRTRDVPDNQKPTVYVGGIGYMGTYGIDSSEGLYPPFEALNARNVAKEASSEHVFASKEQIIKWDPEFIFIDEGGLMLMSDDYSKNPDFYNSLRAFNEGNVYGLLPFNWYTTNIDTAIADTYYIGKILYPDRFTDIDPEKKADEIYTFLVGKPVYDEMSKVYGGFKKVEL